MKKILNFKKYGESSNCLVILHGFLGTLDNWHTLSNRFAGNFTVYNVDQRNHGKSFHAENHTIEHMTEDLLHLIASEGLKHINIIGHSMGGKVAMQFALNYADIVNKLIIVDIAPKQYNPGHDNIFNGIFAVKLDKVKSRKDAENMMLPYIPDIGVRQFILKNLERKPDGSFSWKMNLPILHKDYNEIIKKITSNNTFNKPTLFLKGQNSKYILDSDIPEIASLFKNYTIKTISNAGHWLHAENPNEFYNTVIEFLNT
jgi:pimeloyl-ACP methyl ester carboxylesterase